MIGDEGVEERTASIDRQITVALWAVVVLLLVAAWVVACLPGEDHNHTATMLALTGCATSAYAATRNIRCYALRVSRLIRNLHELDNQPPSVPSQRGVYPVR